MRKLFTLLTVAICSLTAWADDFYFDTPEPKLASTIVADGEHEYFLFLVTKEGDENFYGRGNDFGTRATAIEGDYASAICVRFTPTTQTVDGEEVQCYKLYGYLEDKGGWITSCLDENCSIWTDGGDRWNDNGNWQLTDLGNGKFEITHLRAPKGKLGLAKGRMAWGVVDEETGEEGYITATSQNNSEYDDRLHFIGMDIKDSVDIYSEDGETILERKARYTWGEESYTTWQAYDASLYAAFKTIEDWYYKEGWEYEDDDDVAAALKKAMALFEKEDVTLEEVKQAYDDIITAVDWIAVKQNLDLLAGASNEEPIDATFLIQNPDFEDGTFDGWTSTLRGINTSIMKNDKYGTEGQNRLDNFAESWTWDPQHGGNGEFYQKVGLPAGRYTLEANIIATRQSGSKADSKGVYLFADGPKDQHSIPVATGNNAPEHFTLMFDTEGGGFKIGVREVSPTVNWIAMDNFKLTYFGEPTMSWEQIDLGKYVQSIDEKYAVVEKIAQPEFIEGYENALAAAWEAYENGGLEAEGYAALQQALADAVEALEASMADYRAFEGYIKVVANRLEEFTETEPACAELISALYAEIDGAYADCEWNREQIETILPRLGVIISGYFAERIQPGDDVSVLLNNPTFDTDFSGWSTKKADGYNSPWGGPGTGQPNYTGTMADWEGVVDGCLPSGNAEDFHSRFDMYQIIYGMPRGLYTVTCQAFVRKDGSAAQEAYIYAILPDGTEVKQPVMNLYDGGADERLFANSTIDDEGNERFEWYSDVERNGKFYPNGMGGANFHFAAGYYKNKFSLLVPREGDIQIGIKTDDGTDLWVLFDNFNIVYEGMGPKVWLATIEDEILNLEDKMEAANMTKGGVEYIEKIIDKARAFCKNIDEATEEDCVAILDELKAQYAYITENLALIQQVLAYDNAVYSDAVIDLVEEADEAMQDRYAAICDAIDSECEDLNNEEMKAMLTEIANVLTLLKMPKGWENATDEAPVDFSSLIENPRFHSTDDYADYYLDEYLTIEIDEETGEEFREYNEPTAVNGYNFGNWQGHYFGTGGGEPANCGEVWNDGSFDIYMEFAGLPEGTYELACDGFYRHGGGTTTSAAILAGEREATSNAYLYATSSVGSYSTSLNNIAIPQVTEAEANEMGLDGGKSSANGFVYPDQLRTADNFFKAGLYEKNTVLCKVGADGALRIGIEKIGSVGQDWVVVDNFSLFYHGGASTLETTGDEKTSISAVAVSVAKKAIYTITGVRVQNANKPGLYIINGKKVLVK